MFTIRPRGVSRRPTVPEGNLQDCIELLAQSRAQLGLLRFRLLSSLPCTLRIGFGGLLLGYGSLSGGAGCGLFALGRLLCGTQVVCCLRSKHYEKQSGGIHVVFSRTESSTSRTSVRDITPYGAAQNGPHAAPGRYYITLPPGNCPD